MSTSLLERMMIQKVGMPHPETWDPKVPDNYSKDLADILETRTKSLTRENVVGVRLDNVARYYARHEREYWTPDEHIPNWLPPWEVCFVEWVHPTVWNMSGKLVRTQEKVDLGFMVFRMTVTAESLEEPGKWQNLLERMVGSRLVWDQIWPLLKLAKFVVYLDAWVADNGPPTFGTPTWQGYAWICFLDESGRLQESVGVGITSHLGQNPEVLKSWQSARDVVGLAFSFCHCKNVVLEPLVSALPAKWYRRQKVPQVKYYTLSIGDFLSSRSQPGSGKSTGGKSLHICRGHFATYTEEKPLFGKYVGTVWKPDHTRGTKSSGEVIKRYDVSPRKAVDDL